MGIRDTPIAPGSPWQNGSHGRRDLRAGYDGEPGGSSVGYNTLRTSPPASIGAQFTRSYSLTTALAPFTLRVWLTICLWAALFV
jgi:hypothetical protein